MQPGMPQGSGAVDGTPIITLPGNPVSALVSFEVFIRSPLRGAMGLPAPDRPRRTAVLTEDLTSPRGKRQFRRGVLDPAARHGHQLRAARVASSALAGVGELPAGNRRGRRRARRRVPGTRVGLGIGRSTGRLARRIAARWPDAPTSNPVPRGSRRWCAPPYRRCTPRACRSSARAWRSRHSGTGTAGCGAQGSQRPPPTPHSSGTRRGCHRPVPVSSSRRPTASSV